LDSYNREKITVLIPCYNSEHIIRDCLESVKWADEIFIVDSGSTDKTLDIAKEYTSKIVQHEYVNSATQKNWAIPQCTHQWILIVDTDERVSPALKDEILDKLKGNHPYSGFKIYRLNHFLGFRIRYSGWQNDCVLRLFKRDFGRYQDREVHADIILNGKWTYLKNKLIHYTFTSFDQYMKKFDKYTTWASIDRDKTTKKVKWYHLTIRPSFRFFKQYFLKLGFLDGIPGLIICTLAAYSVFLKYAKLWERRIKEKRQ
jgi:glycosyltransferase involved in cell wall biosynthesis